MYDVHYKTLNHLVINCCFFSFKISFSFWDQTGQSWLWLLKLSGYILTSQPLYHRCTVFISTSSKKLVSIYFHACYIYCRYVTTCTSHHIPYMEYYNVCKKAQNPEDNISLVFSLDHNPDKQRTLSDKQLRLGHP